jgi:hypothetical protein
VPNIKIAPAQAGLGGLHAFQPVMTLNGRLGRTFSRERISSAKNPSKSGGSVVFGFCGRTLIVTTAETVSLARNVSRQVVVSCIFVPGATDEEIGVKSGTARGIIGASKSESAARRITIVRIPHHDCRFISLRPIALA